MSCLCECDYVPIRIRSEYELMQELKRSYEGKNMLNNLLKNNWLEEKFIDGKYSWHLIPIQKAGEQK